MQTQAVNRQNDLSIGRYFYTVLSLLVFLLFLQFFLKEKSLDENTNTYNVVSIPLPKPTPVPVAPATVTPSAPQIATPTAPTFHKEAVSIEKGDTLTSILIDAKVDSDDILAILSLPQVQDTLTLLTPGKQIFLTLNDHGQVQSFRYGITPSKTLTITRTPQDSFKSNIQRLQPVTTTKAVEGRITSSLFDAAHAANISDRMTLQMVNIFAPKIDFRSDLRPGDKFKIVYQNQGASNGNAILGAEITTHGKTYQAIRFKTGKNTYGYFDEHGNSLNKAFIRTPVAYTRVSDPFNPHRRHPILHIIRPHLGVDLAAPRGTPVQASSNAVVAFAGRDGGYGNLIVLDNGHGITTRYGHLNRFAKGLRKGTYVKEGQIIAYVGSTGLATGPHLHYEFRINDVPKNPLTVALPFASSITNAEKYAFHLTAKKIIAELDNARSNIQYAKASSSEDDDENV